MANNLYEFYKSKGQELPSKTQRQSVASKAGITDYTGTLDQNKTLLGYLQNTPSEDTTISPESLQSEKQITTPEVKTYTSTTTPTITGLVKTSQEKIKAEEEANKKASEEYAGGLTKTVDKTNIYDVNQVNEKKSLVNDLTTQMSSAYEDYLTQIEDLDKNPQGKSTSALTAEKNKLTTEYSRNNARMGIALAGATNSYTEAYNIATQQIKDETDSLKADLESKKFILEQSGTKLATEKANAFTLQIKAIDNEKDLLTDAIKTATTGISNGTINNETGYSAIQDLVSGKTSISDFYNNLGIDTGSNATGQNISGYDITSYATDPTHEQKVLSIYSSIPVISDEKSAQDAIDNLSPNSPITGAMVMSASEEYGVDPSLMIALMQQDSNLGTQGLAVKTKNAGNVGNTDSGATVTYDNWGQGVNAVAKWLSNHKSQNNPVDFVYGDFSSTLTPQGKTTFDTLGDSDKTTVMQLVSGDALISDLVKSRGLTGTKEIERLTNLAKKIDPTFSINSNKIKYEAKRQWNLPNGKSFLTRSAMNTAMSHMATTYESAKLLGNTEIPKYNQLQNWFAKNTGNPELTNFVYDLTALAGEVASAYKNGTAPSELDTQRFYDAMSGNMSPEQFKGVFSQSSKLLAGKLKSLAQEYKQSVGNYPTDPIVQPSVLQELKDAGVDTSMIDELLTQQGYQNESVGYDTVLATNLAKLGITDAGNNTLMIPRIQWSKLNNTYSEELGMNQGDALIKQLKNSGYSLLVQ